MKKVFEFGKVAAEGKNKSNLVTLEVELKDTDKGPVLSICANVWDRHKDDIIWGGQCIDDIFAEYGPQLKNKDLYRELMYLWQNYHLNDMNAGTEKQTAAVKKLKAEGFKGDYSALRGRLRELNLLEDEGYNYGSAWLYRPIPETALRRIKEILS